MVFSDDFKLEFFRSIDRDNKMVETIESFNFYQLLFHANSLREKYKGNSVELCAIVNAKSGLCSEDCAFCAQSLRYQTHSPRYSLIEKEDIVEKALEAKSYGVARFSIVMSGRTPSKDELYRVAQALEALSENGISPCASLGLLRREQIEFLRDRGLKRLHCNIETSERYFSRICTTHSFKDKLETIESAISLGLSVCSGGIFGMGESWQDRVEMAKILRELNVDSVPINFFTPIKGTPLEGLEPIKPLDALRVIALFRLILKDKDIRVCGGRPLLGDFASWIFLAGANALMTGNYLTTKGRGYSDDLKFIREHGLEVKDVVS